MVNESAFNIKCEVEGVGYSILWHNMYPKRNILRISSLNIDIVPSEPEPGEYEFNLLALQSLISKTASDLKITSISTPIKVVKPLPKSEKAAEEADSTK